MEDIDEDGDYDFIVGAAYDGSFDGEISLFINNGENNFTKTIIEKETNYPAGAYNDTPRALPGRGSLRS